MTTTQTMPGTWSWPDENGRDHMVTEGSILKEGPDCAPSFEALCGRTVSIRELWLRRRFSHCDLCRDQLTRLIATTLDT